MGGGREGSKRGGGPPGGGKGPSPPLSTPMNVIAKKNIHEGEQGRNVLLETRRGFPCNMTGRA